MKYSVTKATEIHELTLVHRLYKRGRLKSKQKADFDRRSSKMKASNLHNNRSPYKAMQIFNKMSGTLLWLSVRKK